MSMLLSMAAALSAQGEAPPPPAPSASPRPAVYVVDGDYGAPGRPGNLRRLIDEWSRIGAIAALPAPGEARERAPCTLREGYPGLDRDCVLRHYPQRPGEAPTLAIVARDRGRVIPDYKVLCVGPSGIGTASVNMNRGGAFSSDPRELSEVREGMARCVNAALEGALVPSPAATLGFDRWGTGEGDLFYHRLTADCGGLQHRIGRNATRGSTFIPLRAVRWSYEPSAQAPEARFDCLEGDCAETYRAGAASKAGVHRIPFADAARARRFLAGLDALKQACAAR